MPDIVREALALWGYDGADYQLIADRENAVYRIDHNQHICVLRVHRKGYRTNAELVSELQWMNHIATHGIAVPSPIASLSGDVLHTVDNTQVDMLTWLSGTPLIDQFDHMNNTRLIALYSELGRQMATMHTVIDAWTPPFDFTRCHWDSEGLLGDSPLWDRFWENPALHPDERDLLVQFRQHALTVLFDCAATLDYGLIHADLVRQNVLVDGPELQIIDFDDGGYGFRLFDITTVLLKLITLDNYDVIHAALIDGYRSIRALDTEQLDLFMALRATTYVGWNISRLSEPGAQARNRGFIDTAVNLASTYLSTQTPQHAQRH